jgi:superfamily II DNA or RNA helicase
MRRAFRSGCFSSYEEALDEEHLALISRLRGDRTHRTNASCMTDVLNEGYDVCAN